MVGAEGPVPRTTDWRVEVGVVVPVAAAMVALENLTMVGERECSSGTQSSPGCKQACKQAHLGSQPILAVSQMPIQLQSQ